MRFAFDGFRQIVLVVGAQNDAQASTAGSLGYIPAALMAWAMDFHQVDGHLIPVAAKALKTDPIARTNSTSITSNFNI